MFLIISRALLDIRKTLELKIKFRIVLLVLQGIIVIKELLLSCSVLEGIIVKLILIIRNGVVRVIPHLRIAMILQIALFVLLGLFVHLVHSRCLAHLVPSTRIQEEDLCGMRVVLAQQDILAQITVKQLELLMHVAPGITVQQELNTLSSSLVLLAHFLMQLMRSQSLVVGHVLKGIIANLDQLLVI
jgi:hypothetical protein